MSYRFKLLSFAAIAQEDEQYIYQTPFGARTHRRREGEALHPEREPLAVLEMQRNLLGNRFFSAQYLQAPMPAGGNLVTLAALRYYKPWEVEKPDRVVQSWDTASKPSELNNFSVCTTWVIKGQRIYLIDVLRVRLARPALTSLVITHCNRFNAERVLIEDKGSGIGLLQELEALYFTKRVAIQPKGDKILRFQSVTPMIENGRVFLPEAAHWLDTYLHEILSFPSTRYDDQVDSTSQALIWLRDQGTMGGVFEYYRQEAEKSRAAREDRTVQLQAPQGVSHVSVRDGTVFAVGVDGTIWVTEMDAGPLRGAGFIPLPPQQPR